MAYTIRIDGLDRAQAMLGVRIEPALQMATKMIAAEVGDIVKAYPPTTAANDPGNPTGRWYVRGKGGFYRSKRTGEVKQTSESQDLLTSWGIKSYGRWGASVGSRASYAPYVHSKDHQSRAMKRIGWITDETAMRRVIASGAVRRIVTQALVHAMRTRGF